MPAKKTIEWNQDQLKVAMYLGQDKTVQEIVALTGLSKTNIYDLKAKIDGGIKPPEGITEEMIAAAPPPKLMGVTLKYQKANAGGTSGETPAEVPSGGDGKQSKKKVLATKIILKSETVACTLTPIMMLSKQLATVKFKWPEDMPWDDFFDTILTSWFEDRGLHLMAFYDEDTSLPGQVAVDEEELEKAEEAVKEEMANVG